MKDRKIKTIVVDVNRRPQVSYRVNEGQSLTLAIIAHSPRVKEASYKVNLRGRGAKATIIGLIVGNGDSQFSLHTLQKHEAPETTSNLLVKSVLADRAAFSYDGEIRVEKKAQKTDAYQRNENLLLTKDVQVESKPTLEILANDVRCTHGATTSMLDPAQVWYLASRGIKKEAAKKLLVAGFFDSAIFLISDKIRDKIRRILWQSL